ncbi:MAG TPA: cobalamin-independent methionine synthase II family protein [Ilumatobacter sp.]|jgi:5-methyltetrahydropteroyltriglutamate--homocysteine methyltransferase|nr:cobalamin-independent methionine synthase II family protein [Ilumatobacter sp.]
MKTSTDRILTTHVGSLARPVELLDTMKEKEHGRPYDHALFDKQVREAVADRVRKQVENGIDIVTDGEMSKVSFLGYVKDRLGGFEVEEGGSGPAPSWQVEIDMFPEYYADYMAKYSAAVAPLRRIIARGPISYVGHDLLEIDIDNLKAAVAAVREDGFEVADVFMPSSGPSGFGRNEYYASNSEYLAAVADAMREEYLAIVDAGFILQIDDPWLIELLTESQRPWEESVVACNEHVDALNHALRDIPIQKIRHHTCYGLNHGPRLTDVPLAKVVPFMTRINAGAYSFEVANPRHQHEYRVWEDHELPEDRVLIPGFIGHANNYVEHEELIAEYIVRYANMVGKERVIAGADCGFSSRASYKPEVHPTVVWPKFQHLAMGAELATKRLWS